MILSELSPGQLIDRLAHPGLFIRTGPFVFQIQTKIPRIAQGLRLLYGDCTIISRSGFADFHVRIGKSLSLRRGFRPLVSVQVDGDLPSVPVPLEQVYAVFEGSLNWCIYSQAYQYLIIHAAAIERGGRAAILPAPPGSGKSTLCAALVSRGWRLLTDELTLIETDSRAIVPLARPVSLKNDSIDVIRRFVPDAVFGPISPNTIKGTIAHMKPPPESVRRAGEHCSAAWLIMPRYQSGRPTSVHEIAKAEGFMRIAESAVNYMALGQMGFDLVSALVEEMDCYRLEYSNLNEAVRWFEELSLNDNGFPIKPAAS